MKMCACVSVCVRDRERERERMCEKERSTRIVTQFFSEISLNRKKLDRCFFGGFGSVFWRSTAAPFQDESERVNWKERS